MEQLNMKRVQVTPDLAKKLLDQNPGNRKLSDTWIRIYANQMRAGEWMETGDTIKLGPDGRLLDGQHRLSGVISYGKPVWMWFAYNVDPDAFMVLDTGKRRSTGDMVHIAGHKYATGIAAMARGVLMTQDGYKRDRSAMVVSNQAIMEFIEQNPEIQEIMPYLYQVIGRLPFKTGISLIGPLYWHFSQKSTQKADEFFEGLCEGVDLGKQNPIRLLRERLMKDYNNKSRLKTHERAALFVYAWNAFRQKRELNNLQLPATGDFPKII